MTSEVPVLLIWASQTFLERLTRNLTLCTQFFGVFFAMGGLVWDRTRWDTEKSDWSHYTACISKSVLFPLSRRKEKRSILSCHPNIPPWSLRIFDWQWTQRERSRFPRWLAPRSNLCVCVYVWEWGKERDWIRGTDPTQTRCLGLKHVITRRLARLCDVAFRRTAPRPWKQPDDLASNTPSSSSELIVMDTCLPLFQNTNASN